MLGETELRINHIPPGVLTKEHLNGIKLDKSLAHI